MVYKLYLDDQRDPPSSEWVTVRSYKEFCNTILEKGLPTHISFDIDLRDIKTGFDCAKFLKTKLPRNLDNPIKVYCHSASLHSFRSFGEDLFLENLVIYEYLE